MLVVMIMVVTRRFLELEQLFDQGIEAATEPVHACTRETVWWHQHRLHLPQQHECCSTQRTPILLMGVKEGPNVLFCMSSTQGQ
jgi:hypothetical protein